MRYRHRTKIGNLMPTVLAALVMSTVLSSCSQSREAPQLILDGSVASDLEALAVETWAQFLVVFEARTDCFGDVHLRAARALGSRAAYDPASATVTVRVPGTPAMLQGALIHEWAHHIEFQCAAHKELRSAFLAAQRLPPDTPWRGDRTPAQTPVSQWPGIPSEQYAEAAIVLVLGRRQIPTGVRLTEEAVHAVAVWAAGD
jgi:hypothetical protein